MPRAGQAAVTNPACRGLQKDALSSPRPAESHSREKTKVIVVGQNTTASSDCNLGCLEPKPTL